MAQNKRDYILNFKTNVEGLDTVLNDLKKLSNTEGVSVGAQISKDLQRAEVELKAFKDQLSSALDSSNLSNNDLLVMDKQLAQIIKTLRGVSAGFAGILPKETEKEIVEFSNSLEKNLELLKAAQKSVRAYDLHLSKDENGNLLGLRDRYKNASLKTAAGGSYDDIDLGDGVKVNSYEEFAQALAKVRQEGKLTAAQLQKLAQIEAETERLNQAKLDKILGLQTAKQAEVDAIQKEIALQQQQAGVTNNSTSTTQQLNTAEQQYIQILQELIVTLSKLEVSRLNNNNALHTEINAKNSSAESERQLKSVIDQTTNSREKNTSILGQATRQVITYGGAVSLLRNILNTTRRTIEEMDEALTGMAVVTTMSREQAWELTTTFQGLANETGKTTAEIANMATKFYQQGKSTTQVIELTRAAAMAASIAGIDGSRSIDLLTNAMNGFQMSATQALEVSDKFAALAAAAATDYEELAVALSKVAAQANLAGMSMDFTLGLLTAGIEVTREAPETIGTALKTIIARMRELTDYGKTLEDGVDVNRVAAALDNIGIALMDETGQFRDLEEVITEIGTKWNTLNKNQQANVAVAMAGTRQQSRFIAMMQDFERTQELVNISANSYGATLAQQAKYMGGLEAATNKLTTAYQALITNFVQSDFFIRFTNNLTEVVSALDFILNKLHGSIPLLIAIGGYAVTRLNVVIQEKRLAQEKFKLEQQELSVQRQQEIAQINAAKQARVEQKITLEQAILDQESVVKGLDKLVLEKKITVQRLQQNLLQEQANGNTTKAAMYQNRLTTAMSNLTALEQQRVREQQKLTDLKTEDTKLAVLQSQEMAYQASQGNLLVKIMNSLSGVVGTILGGFGLISNIINLFPKKEKSVTTEKIAQLNAEKGITTEKIKQAAIDKVGGSGSGKYATTIKDKGGATLKNLLKGGQVGVEGGVSIGAAAAALASVAAIIGSIALIINTVKNVINTADNAAEHINQISVELYNAQQSANNIRKISTEFETLSSKVNKTNEELERMIELAQQANDEAGFTVVDLDASVDEQLEQLRAYEQLTQDQMALKSTEMENAMSDSLKSSRGWAWGGSIGAGVLGGAGIGFLVGGPIGAAIGLAVGAIAGVVGGAIAANEVESQREEMIKSEAGQAMIDSVMSNRSKTYQESNSEIQKAVVKIITDDWRDFFDRNNTLLYDKVDNALATIDFSAMNDAMASGDLEELSATYDKIIASGNRYADALLDSIPVFQTIKVLGSDLTKALDQLGMQLDDVNILYDALTSPLKDTRLTLEEFKEKLQNIIANPALTELEKQQAITSAVLDERINEAAEYAKIRNDRYYSGPLQEEARKYWAAIDDLQDQEWIDRRNEALRAYNEETDDKKKETKFQEYQTIAAEKATSQAIVDAVEGRVIDTINAIDSVTAAIFDAKTANETKESIISLISSMKNLQDKMDLTALSFEEQMELIEEYPQLQNAIGRGFITAQEKVGLFETEFNELIDEANLTQAQLQEQGKQLLQAIGTSSINGTTYDNRLFTDTQEGLDLRTSLLTMSSEARKQAINDIVATYGYSTEEAETYFNKLQEYVKDYNNSLATEDYLTQGGIAALWDEETKELMAAATDSFTKIKNSVEAYATQLERLTVGTDEYNQVLSKWQSEAHKLNKELLNDQKELEEQKLRYLGGDERLAGLVSFINGAVVVDPSATDDDSEYIASVITPLEELADKQLELDEERYSLNESRIQQVIDLEQELSDKRVAALEAQQEAYESYFDEADAAREEAEYEQDRESLIKQISGLVGGADSASKQQMKDLQQQLRELEEEQLDAQRENQRDALLQRISDAIEAEQTTMDNLNNAITDLVNWLQNTDATPEDIQNKIEDAKDGTLTSYSTGGLVKTTGPVMVHGTPSKPEAFLSATDTKNMRNLFDTLNTLTGIKFNSSVDNIEQPGNYVIEQITIQPAQLNNNQDWAQAGNILATEIFKASKKRGITFNVKK